MRYELNYFSLNFFYSWPTDICTCFFLKILMVLGIIAINLILCSYQEHKKITVNKNWLSWYIYKIWNFSSCCLKWTIKLTKKDYVFVTSLLIKVFLIYKERENTKPNIKTRRKILKLKYSWLSLSFILFFFKMLLASSLLSVWNVEKQQKNSLN